MRARRSPINGSVRRMHWTPTPGRARHDLPNDSKPRSNCGYSSSRDVLDYARSLTNIPRIEPRIVMKDGEMTILMSGDDGYED